VGTRTSFFTVSLVSILSVGCSYIGSRSQDFSDILRMEVGYPAIGVYAEATPLIHTGLDVWLAAKSHSGKALGTFETRTPEPSQFLAYSVLLFHARGFDPDPVPADQDPEEYALSEEAIQKVPHAGTMTHAHEMGRAFENPQPDHLRVIRWADVEIDVGALLGLRMRASPGELMDFALGWIGLDIGEDDS